MTQGSPQPDKQPNNTFTKRGLNWTREEDKQLCHSWLNASTDSNGSSSIWNCIKEHYDSHMSNRGEDRSVVSLKARWHVIKTNVLAYSNALSYVKDLHANDPNADLYALANQHFQSLSNSKKDFAFNHCWSILNKASKWDMVLAAEKAKGVSKKRNSSTNVSTSNTPDISAPANEPLPQPLDNDKVPHKRKSEELLEKIYENQEKILKMFSTLADINVMKVDVDTITNTRRKQYFIDKQEEVLRRSNIEPNEAAKSREEGGSEK